MERDPLNANNDGLKVNRATNFLINFTLANNVPTDGAFTIIMPTESDAQIDSASSTFTCKASDCTAGTALTCTATSATRTVLITDFCSVSAVGSCNAGSVVSICLTSSFMKNMGWIKAPLTSTDSFEIKSGIAGGVYFIDNINASVTATPTLLPDLMSFTSPEITRNNDTVNAKIDWEVYITFTTNALVQSGYIYLTLPDDVVYDMGFTLDSTLTSNSSAVVGNSKTLYSSGALKVITLTSICGVSSCASASTLQIKISWIKNPPAITTNANTIQVNSATSSGWIIDQGTSSAVSTIFSALTIEKVSSIIISPADPSAGAITNYDILFTANTDIPQSSYIIITIPADITISATNAGGATSLDTCSNIFVTSVTLTCTVGTNSTGATTIKVEGIFPNTVNSGQFGTKIGLMQNPVASGVTGQFQVDIYTAAGVQIASENNTGGANTGTIKTSIPTSN